jgi:hypothetical protein
MSAATFTRSTSALAVGLYDHQADAYLPGGRLVRIDTLNGSSCIALGVADTSVSTTMRFTVAQACADACDVVTVTGRAVP